MVLVLSVMPCADEHEAFAKSKERCQVGQKHDENDHHSICSDICSPFCHCSCCGGVVLTAHTVQLSLSPVLYLKEQYSDLPSQGIKEISLSVWQPPQLV
jgi:hypothetical protein